MRVSGKSLLKMSVGVSTTSNVGPASSWNSLIAMGVVECFHSAVSAEVRRELGAKLCKGLYTGLVFTTSSFSSIIWLAVNSGIPTQAQYVTTDHQCTSMCFLTIISTTLIFSGGG